MTNTPANNSNVTGALFGLLAFAVFSTHDVIIKYLGGAYSPFQILFFSSLFSFPILAVRMIGDKEPGTLRPNNPGWVAIRSLSGVVGAAGAFYAFTVLPLAEVYAILFASPLLITLMAIPILGEKVGLHRGVAVVAGLIGVIVVLRPSSAGLGMGHVAALAAAFGSALTSIVVRKIGHEERSVVMILYPMFANFVLMGALMPFVYVPMQIEDLGALFVVAILVLIAMSSLITAYTRGAAVVVAPMQYSQILWAALFGALFFAEYPDTITYIGAGIITLSGLYILRRESSGNVSENKPVLETKTRPGLPAGLRVGSLSNLSQKED